MRKRQFEIPESVHDEIMDALSRLGLCPNDEKAIMEDIADRYEESEKQNVDYSGHDDEYDNDDSYCPAGGDYWRNDAGEYCYG